MRADQQIQGVRVPRDLAGIARDVGARIFDRGARLVQVEPADRAELVSPLGQPEGGALIFERRLRDLLQRLVRGKRQIGIGDFGDETQLRGAPRLFLREVSLERRAAQIAHASEEVELEVGDAEATLYAFSGAKSPPPARVAAAPTPNEGNWSARWMRYCARARSTFSTATRRSRLLSSARAISSRSAGSTKKSRQPMSAVAAGVAVAFPADPPAGGVVSGSGHSCRDPRIRCRHGRREARAARDREHGSERSQGLVLVIGVRSCRNGGCAALAPGARTTVPRPRRRAG